MVRPCVEELSVCKFLLPLPYQDFKQHRESLIAQPKVPWQERARLDEEDGGPYAREMHCGVSATRHSSGMLFGETKDGKKHYFIKPMEAKELRMRELIGYYLAAEANTSRHFQPSYMNGCNIVRRFITGDHQFFDAELYNLIKVYAFCFVVGAIPDWNPHNFINPYFLRASFIQSVNPLVIDTENLFPDGSPEVVKNMAQTFDVLGWQSGDPIRESQAWREQQREKMGPEEFLWVQMTGISNPLVETIQRVNPILMAIGNHDPFNSHIQQRDKEGLFALCSRVPIHPNILEPYIVNLRHINGMLRLFEIYSADQLASGRLNHQVVIAKFFNSALSKSKVSLADLIIGKYNGTHVADG